MRTGVLGLILVAGATLAGSSEAAGAQERPVPRIPMTFRWGPQRLDLLRYNRVEGLSIGARWQVRPGTPIGPLSVTVTGRMGTAYAAPSAGMVLSTEGLKSRVAWSLFHELTEVDERNQGLGPVNSLTALTVGRDDGEYYRRSGVAFEWTPTAALPRTFRVRAYAEHHRPVATATRFTFTHATSSDWAFRDNIVAREGWEIGGLASLTPWWGRDPSLPRGGVEVTAQAAGGDFPYARALLGGRFVAPLGGGLQVDVEGEAGTSWGHPPPQRLWILGGQRTLRGYGSRALEGGSFARGRGEFGRLFSFGTVSLLSDVAWAGERSRVRFDDALVSVGVAVTLVDGLIHTAAAWGVRRRGTFRLEAALDGVR